MRRVESKSWGGLAVAQWVGRQLVLVLSGRPAIEFPGVTTAVVAESKLNRIRSGVLAFGKDVKGQPSQSDISRT